MSATPRFELYSYWRTSATYRVRVALNLKGVVAWEHGVNLDAGEQRRPEFLKVNPLGAIPALIDHATDAAPGVATPGVATLGVSTPGVATLGASPEALTQSMAILEYLDEIYPSPALLPTGARARARVRGIAGMLTADTHPLIVPRIKKYLVATAGFDDTAWKAWQTHWLTTGLQAVEQWVAEHPETGIFCHGDSPTMADICLASVVVVIRVFKIQVPGIPTIDRIIAACERLDSFAKADPYAQVGAPSR